MDKSQITMKCVICGKTFYGFGNDPAPVKYIGRCCDDCNAMTVVLARISLLRGAEK